MKKIVLLVVVAVACCLTMSAWAEPLQIGMKASNWTFKDSEDVDFTMDSWPGRVLCIAYVDPDEADLNEHFTEALKKKKDEGILNDNIYRGMGIADCASTWKPDFAINLIAGAKAKKYKTTILFDYDATLRNQWGLKEDTSNIIIVDKDRVCRAIVRGRVPDDQVEPLTKLVIELATGK